MGITQYSAVLGCRQPSWSGVGDEQHPVFTHHTFHHGLDVLVLFSFLLDIFTGFFKYPFRTAPANCQVFPLRACLDQ